MFRLFDTRWLWFTMAFGILALWLVIGLLTISGPPLLVCLSSAGAASVLVFWLLVYYITKKKKPPTGLIPGAVFLSLVLPSMMVFLGRSSGGRPQDGIPPSAPDNKLVFAKDAKNEALANYELGKKEALPNYELGKGAGKPFIPRRDPNAGLPRAFTVHLPCEPDVDDWVVVKDLILEKDWRYPITVDFERNLDLKVAFSVDYEDEKGELIRAKLSRYPLFYTGTWPAPAGAYRQFPDAGNVLRRGDNYEHEAVRSGPFEYRVFCPTKDKVSGKEGGSGSFTFILHPGRLKPKIDRPGTYYVGGP